MTYLGLLAQGQNDFDAIEAFRDDPFFALSLGLAHVPSSPTLRRHIHCDPIRIGTKEFVPVDIDVSPFDNSKTHKEGVSRTYKGSHGYAPIFAFLGHEGTCAKASSTAKRARRSS